MTQRNAAFLGCRLMAVWFAIGGVTDLPMAWASRTALAELTGTMGSSQTFARSLIENAGFYKVGSQLLVAGLLFYGAGFLSGVLARVREHSEKPLGPRGLFASGSMLIGVFVAANWLPNLLERAFSSSPSLENEGPNAADKVANFVGIGMAILLLVVAFVMASRQRSPDRQDAD